MPTVAAHHFGQLHAVEAIDRGHLLARMLRPFARRPNVFVADDDVVTKVTIHKDATVDIEIAIDTATRSWSVTVRGITTGNVLSHVALPPSDRAQLLRELRTFLEAVVEPNTQVLASYEPLLAAATAGGWRHVTCFC